jgi:O-antigen ligase
MSAWLTPDSIAAYLVTLGFAAVAIQRPGRGVLWYAVLGAVPLQMGAFAGRTISQGLMLAEVLASVLLGVWLVKRRPTRLLQMPFDLPIVIFFLLALTSFVAILAYPDYKIEDKTTLSVSVGQLMLIIWPIAVYLAASEFLTSTRQLQWLQRITIGLAVAQLAEPFLPKAYDPYTGWIWTFGLFAAPFALAAIFESRSLLARLFYVMVAILPFVRGVEVGKAFLYVFVASAVGTIMWVRASKLAVIGGGVVMATALALLVVFGERVFTDPVDDLLNKERKQYSYGGASGRGALAVDAFTIWQEAPVIGVGPANSYVYMLQRAPIGTPHNQYLNILVEFGLLGLVGWISFLVIAFRTGLDIYRKAELPAHRTFVLGWLGMFAGLVVGGGTGDFMIHSIRNGGLELFSGYYLQWVFLGGLVAVQRLERNRPLHETAAGTVAARRGRFAPLVRRPATARVSVS